MTSFAFTAIPWWILVAGGLSAGAAVWMLVKIVVRLELAPPPTADHPDDDDPEQQPAVVPRAQTARIRALQAKINALEQERKGDQAELERRREESRQAIERLEELGRKIDGVTLPRAAGADEWRPPAEIGFDGKDYRLLRRQARWDTMKWPRSRNGTTCQEELFLTRYDKSLVDANFFGDESLTREGTLYLIRSVRMFLVDDRGVPVEQIRPKDRVLLAGTLELFVSSCERRRLVEIPLRLIHAPGAYDLEPVEEFVIPGGRVFGALLTWPNGIRWYPTSGPIREDNRIRDLRVELDGYEYERKSSSSVSPAAPRISQEASQALLIAIATVATIWAIIWIIAEFV